jgi:nicotinate-nucleotide pyrophosphorylase (carboxylating)
MSGAVAMKDVEELIRLAVREDIGSGDITSRAIFGESDVSEAAIISRERGILCGTDLVGHVYGYIDRSVEVTCLMHDGDEIGPGDRVVLLKGPTIGLLSGERTVLNFLQRMSGVASRTASAVSLLDGTAIALLDTRKTVPGFRMLDKYAVKTGGGMNHRMGLYDMVMIKDNHIRAAGGVGRAIRMVRERYGTRYRIEAEASTLEEAREAAAEGADIIMLDNMDRSLVKAAIEVIAKKAKIEVSGNLDEEKIRGMIDLDIDYLSMGSITHSAAAFDFSIEFS